VHEAFNARRFDRLAELLDEDVRLVGGGQVVRGRSAAVDYAATARDVPGVCLEIEEVLVETAETIVVHTRAVAVSAGAGDAATSGDAPRSVDQCEVYRIAGGRITELRYLDPGSFATARLVAEQSALRRVATLVAGATSSQQVFEAIVSEAAELFGTWIWLYRHDAGEALTLVAHRAHLGAGEPVLASHVPPGSPIDRARRSGRPVRVDPYSGPPTAVGVTACAVAPLVVGGRPWGGLGALTRGPPLEPGIEDRLARFAELAATAVANAQSRAELERLAGEQAALRRVAELVARGAATQEVFDRVTVEARRVVDDNPMTLMRYDASGTVAEIAAQDASGAPVGLRIPVEGNNGPAQLWRTGRAVRIDDYRAVASPVEPRWIAAGVIVPIVVEGRLWGALAAGSTSPLPAGTEERLAGFGELVGAAIADAESRAELVASRARVVASADDARRRLARDVHDGAQRRLVHALIAVKQARTALREGAGGLQALLDASLGHAQGAYEELRRLAHGIMPAALEQGGLQLAVEALVADIGLVVEAEVSDRRLPEAVETTAYFVVAEALTNVVKHAGADRARVRARPEGDWLTLEISDDGCGGAAPGRGSGLVGLSDRVQAAGGTISVTSPPGAGTAMSVILPLTLRPDHSGANPATTKSG
jgi:signal transduction histidine kinase